MSELFDDMVVVRREHLEDMYNALHLARSYHQAKDLAEGYRDGRVVLRPSKLTNILTRVYNRVEGYLNDVSTDESV